MFVYPSAHCSPGTIPVGRLNNCIIIIPRLTPKSQECPPYFPHSRKPEGKRSLYWFMHECKKGEKKPGGLLLSLFALMHPFRHLLSVGRSSGALQAGLPELALLALILIRVAHRFVPVAAWIRLAGIDLTSVGGTDRTAARVAWIERAAACRTSIGRTKRTATQIVRVQWSTAHRTSVGRTDRTANRAAWIARILRTTHLPLIQGTTRISAL